MVQVRKSWQLILLYLLAATLQSFFYKENNFSTYHEIKNITKVVYPLILKYDIIISYKPVSHDTYEQESNSIFYNVQRSIGT